MTKEEKNRFDALELLRAAAYSSFNDRRSYEWKMCISIWTPFALYIGYLVTKQSHVSETNLAIGTAAVSALVLVIQVFWTIGLSRANRIDNGFELSIRKELYAALNYSTPITIQKDIDKANRTKGTLWHWSHRTQLLLTLLLGIVATIAAALRHS